MQISIARENRDSIESAAPLPLFASLLQPVGFKSIWKSEFPFHWLLVEDEKRKKLPFRHKNSNVRNILECEKDFSEEIYGFHLFVGHFQFASVCGRELPWLCMNRKKKDEKKVQGRNR